MKTNFMAPSETTCRKQNKKKLKKKYVNVCLNLFSQLQKWLFETGYTLLEREWVHFYLILALKERNQAQFKLSSELFQLFDEV